MYLTEAEVQKYNEEGYLLLYEKFSQAEVDRMKEEMGKVFDEDSPRRVLEKDGKTVRSVYGSHFDSEVFRQISVEPRLVLPAMQILDDKIYVYQFKINAKLAFKGDVWEWHQDFIFWHNEDGIWLAPLSRPKSDKNKVERKATTTSVFKQSVARQACNS